MMILARRFALATLIAAAGPALAQSVPVKGADNNTYNLRAPNPDGRAAAASSAPVVLSNEDQTTLNSLLKGCTATTTAPTYTNGATGQPFSCDLAGNLRAYLANTSFGITGVTPVGGRLPVDGSGVVQPVSSPADIVATPTLDLTAVNNTTTPLAVAGQQTVTLVLPSLGTAVVVVETSSDGNVTWISHGLHQAGLGVFASSNSVLTVGGTYRGNVNGIGSIRLRVSTVGTGTITPTWRLTDGSGIIAATALTVAGTTGGATPYHLTSAASSNSTLISAGPHTLYTLSLAGINTTVAYVRLYDSATAPTCSSATGAVHTYPVLGSATAFGGIVVPLPAAGEAFVNGIGFCITGGASDTDATSAVAGVLVNATYK